MADQSFTFSIVLKLLGQDCLDVFGVGRENDSDVFKNMQLGGKGSIPTGVGAGMFKDPIPELLGLVREDRSRRVNWKVKGYTEKVSSWPPTTHSGATDQGGIWS